MRLSTLAGPAVEPVSTAEAKLHLRIDHADADALLALHIAAARESVEAASGQYLIYRTVRLTLDDWALDAQGAQPVPIRPVASLVAVRTLGPDGSAQTSPADAVRLDAGPRGARVVFAAGPPPVRRSIAGIEIDCVAGHGAVAAAVPALLRQAILGLVAAAWSGEGAAAIVAQPRL